MIQREKKRERLIAKYVIKRESIKEELKNVSSFKERLALYKKFERIPKKRWIKPDREVWIQPMEGREGVRGGYIPL